MKVAGIGFRAGATIAALRQVLDRAEAAGGRVAALATLPEKAGAPQMVALADERSLPVLGVSVKGVRTPTRSARIIGMHGTGSVAEAAALVAAGMGATLVVARIVSADGMATAAIAAGSGEGK